MVDRYAPDSDEPYLSEYGVYVKYSDYEELLLACSHHDWLCGCGHWNGPSLATCAVCRLSPGNNE